MKNLRLIPSILRQQPIVKAKFASSEDMIALVKAQDNGTGLEYIHELLGCVNSKTTELNTRTSKKILAKIKRPLDEIIKNQSKLYKNEKINSFTPSCLHIFVYRFFFLS